MVYRKRYRSRKRLPGRQPSVNNRGYLAGAAATAANVAYLGRQIYYLKGLVNSELKKIDTTLSTAVSSSGQVNSLCDIAQGDTRSTRDGNSIFVRSVNMQGTLKQNSSATQTAVRLWVVYDRQQIADTDPSFGDIFSGTGTGVHLNVDTVGRFKILAERSYTMSANGKDICNVKVNIPLRHHIRYNGAASSDLQKGCIYVVMTSDEATNTPTPNLHCRLSWHDN